MAIAASLLSGSVAEADTFQVNSTSDDAAKTTCDGTVVDGCSLRGAILDANANAATADIITFASTVTGTIALGGTRLPDITDEVDIQGPGADVLTVDAGGNSQIFYEDNAADLSISGLTLYDGNAIYMAGQSYSDEGGAVLSRGSGSLTLSGMTIQGSSAYSGGGVVKRDGPLYVSGSTIAGNTATSFVGGICVVGGNVSVEDSTVSGNTATPGGADGAAGIAEYAAGNMTIRNSTVTGNDGGAGSGGVYSNAAGMTLESTIVAGNTGATANDVYASSPIQEKYSLIEDDSNGFSIGSGHSNLNGQDPQLGTLGDFGGPTPTIRPAGTSPVIDQGSDYTSTGLDQRGMTIYDDPNRANADDGRDIGAVELQAGEVASPAAPSGPPADAPPVVSGLSPSSGTDGTAVAISGRNFEHATKVLFGTTAATFTVDGFEHITARAPTGLTGAVDVTVVNPAGQSANSSADQFTFVAPPSPAVTPTPTSPSPAAVICRSVPNLLRHTLHGVRQLLKSHGCSAVPVSHSGHAKHPPSHVKGQSVAPGTTMHEGDKLKLKLH